MALPTVGGGYQISDGNTNEMTLGVQAAPIAKTAAATLTAAELLVGLITYNGAAANLTLPTVALLEAALVNAKTNSSFNFTIIDLGGAGVSTVVTATGWTLVGSMATIANVGTQFRARKTGDAAWTLYRAS